MSTPTPTGCFGLDLRVEKGFDHEQEEGVPGRMNHPGKGAAV